MAEIKQCCLKTFLASLSANRTTVPTLGHTYSPWAAIGVAFKWAASPIITQGKMASGYCSSCKWEKSTVPCHRRRFHLRIGQMLYPCGQILGPKKALIQCPLRKVSAKEHIVHWRPEMSWWASALWVLRPLQYICYSTRHICQSHNMLRLQYFRIVDCLVSHVECRNFHVGMILRI